jgi:hypothetical protein
MRLYATHARNMTAARCKPPNEPKQPAAPPCEELDACLSVSDTGAKSAQKETPNSGMELGVLLPQTLGF